MSTENTLNKILSYVYTEAERNKISMLVLLHLPKAFYSVNCKILLNKLIKYNIDTFWFSSYLNNGTHNPSPPPSDSEDNNPEDPLNRSERGGSLIISEEKEEIINKVLEEYYKFKDIT